jgi:hypothetical protein
MPYKLEVNNPEFPKDAEFDCDGILVKNGSSVTLTKEDEIAFIARWGSEIKDIYGHGTIAKVTGSSELSKKEREDAMPTASVTAEAEATAENGGE